MSEKFSIGPKNIDANMDGETSNAEALMIQADISPEHVYSSWKFAVSIMIVGFIVFLLFIAYRALVPTQWEFGLEISTEFMEINLRPDTETRWLIDGAIICTRQVIDVSPKYEMIPSAEYCGSRAWKAWHIQEPEQVLRFNGGVSAFLEVMNDGSFAMTLRSINDQPLGSLSVIGVVDDISMGTAINLIWTPESLRSLTFPFSGSTVLGKAVSWSNSSLLQSGGIAVYTSDKSADHRVLVDEAELMLGDQLSLVGPEGNGIWPKGFIRVSKSGGPMDVVAFGTANSLKIERYGNSGYDFKPGFISKMISDPMITLFASLLASYVSLIMTIRPFINEKPVEPVLNKKFPHFFLNWLRKVK